MLQTSVPVTMENIPVTAGESDYMMVLVSTRSDPAHSYVLTLIDFAGGMYNVTKYHGGYPESITEGTEMFLVIIRKTNIGNAHVLLYAFTSANLTCASNHYVRPLGLDGEAQ